MIKINTIKPNPNNPRIIKDDKFAKLVKSLTEFPEMMAKRPLVCVTDVDGKIYPLGGNMRLKALQEIKYKEIPDDWVIMADEWPEEKRKEFVIKDNVGFGEWDWDELANDWDAEQLTDWGLDIPNFEVAQEAVEDDFNGVPPKEPITALGDLYELNEHRLHCADSCDSDAVAKLMNGKKVDMVFTDPPYNVAFNGRSGKFDIIKNDDLPEDEFNNFIDGFLSMLEIINANTYYICCNWAFYGVMQLRLKPKACIVWAKNVFGLGRGYRHQHEFILFDGFIDASIKNESDLWEIKKDSNYVHPTQKPVEIPARALKNSTKEGNIIVDLFGGSGVSFIASDQLNRICYGQELDPKYCDVIVARYIKHRKETGSSLIIKRNGQQLSEYEINKYIENTENKQ